MAQSNANGHHKFLMYQFFDISSCVSFTNIIVSDCFSEHPSLKELIVTETFVTNFSQIKNNSKDCTDTRSHHYNEGASHF